MTALLHPNQNRGTLFTVAVRRHIAARSAIGNSAQTDVQRRGTLRRKQFRPVGDHHVILQNARRTRPARVQVHPKVMFDCSLRWCCPAQDKSIPCVSAIPMQVADAVGSIDKSGPKPASLLTFLRRCIPLLHKQLSGRAAANLLCCAYAQCQNVATSGQLVCIDKHCAGAGSRLVSLPRCNRRR